MNAKDTSLRGKSTALRAALRDRLRRDADATLYPSPAMTGRGTPAEMLERGEVPFEAVRAGLITEDQMWATGCWAPHLSTATWRRTIKIAKFAVAESPAKADILAILDQLRAEVERGETISLVTIAIQTGRDFHVRSAGDVSMVQLAGYLGAAQLDALNALRK